MASRYWVGGTAAWDGTAGTKWALTSGGAGGQAVPTTADDVFFDAASGAVTCTMAAGNTGAKSINCTGFTGTITSSGSPAYTIAGSITLVAGMTWNSQAIITISATGTLTTAGKIINILYIDATGGTVTLGSALTLGDGMYLTNGTFNTSASNYSVTMNYYFQSNNNNTRTITLNGSTITINAPLTGWQITGSGITLNAGTSTINLGYWSTPTFQGGGLTYNNVSFTDGTPGQRISLTGANTYNQLSFTAPSSAGIISVTFDSNQTITTMVCSGSAANRRIFLRPTEIVASVTINATTWTTVSDVDFQKITLTNAKSPTRGGNCGGNSNITFPVAKTVYWNLAGAQNWSATGWATSSGGAPAVNNFPLAQDTAVFDNTGSVTGTITVDAAFNVGTVNMSARTNAMSLDLGSAGLYVYGDWTFGTGVTNTAGAALFFAGHSKTQTVTSNGRSFYCQFLGQYGTNNTISFADAWSASSSNGIYLYGTTGITLNNNTITTPYFECTSSSARTFAFGTGNITVTTAQGFWIIGTSLTVTGTPVLNYSYTGATTPTYLFLTGAYTESNSISVNFTAGTYTLDLTQAAVFKNLSFTGFAGTLSATPATTIYGNLTISTGMTLTASTSAMSFRATSGTKTITTNGKTLDFPITFNGVGGTWQLQDNFTIGSTRTTTLTNGTFDLNGKTYTAGTVTTATGTKNITFNGGTLTVTGSGGSAFNNAAPTNFTTTAGTGTGTIKMSSASAKTFVGAGSTFNCTLDQGGAGALTITGSSTFNNITASYTATAACSILFTAATTSTFSNWNASGTAGKLLTIGSVTAATHTLSKSSGTVSANYLSLSYSTATGGATWYAGASSTNGGNNTGWIFTAPPSGNGNFILLM